MDAADKADILRRWSAFQRVLGRPEHELTWRNCMRELDLDKRTRCLDCGMEDGGSYMVRNDVWALTGLVYADGVLCLDCLSHRLGRPLRLDDFPMEVPLNRESWTAIWRAVTGSDSA
jgi:hypothetical protein